MAFIPQIVCAAVEGAARVLKEAFVLLSGDVLVDGGSAPALAAVVAAPMPTPTPMPAPARLVVACKQNSAIAGGKRSTDAYCFFVFISSGGAKNGANTNTGGDASVS